MSVVTWVDVDALAARLPDAVLGEAHEGSPAWFVGRHQFARLRWDEEREILQFWTGDMDAPAWLRQRLDVFPVVHTFRFRVSAWGYLDRLDLREAAELVLDSYAIRGGARRRSSVDLPAFLPDQDG